MLIAALFAGPVFALALPQVKLFTTGGTIQSKGADREKLMEYSDGRVAPQELIDDLPELKQVAQISYMEISNVGSGNIDTKTLLRLAHEINAWLAQPEAAGAVVTHGTATLEETAYFLNLTVKSNKPVVLVGAMRPFTAVSRDGPMNLYNAVRVAADSDAKGYGVMILLNDEINAARDTTKSNTYRVETFTARDLGPIGFADSDRIVFYRRPLYKHTYESEFDVSDLTALPRVDVTYTHQEADSVDINAFVRTGAKGIVLTGAGGDAVGRAQKKGVVFVQSDRKGAGRVATSERQAGLGIVTSDNLPPQKARILLRLALTRTSDPKQIQRMFDEY
jgi:L-asparaginase